VLKSLKQSVGAIPILGPGLRWLWNWYPTYKRDPYQNLRKAFKGAKDLNVIQIGSNDGSSGDPLYRLLKRNASWKALFIEPVPYAFKKLRNNYGSDVRFCFENVAIGKKIEKVNFYYVSELAKEQLSDLPYWYDQLGSFNPDHITNHLGERIRPYIVVEQVDCVPLPLILERNHVDRIDLLHIDTEGADWMILQQLDLDRYAPDVILIEHKHLSPQEIVEMRSFLGSRYQMIQLAGDFFCRRLSTKR